MQNLYPLFERNRILKKELLWALRDYSFSHVGLEYQRYGEGILQGCDIRIEGREIVVEPGMIKYGDYVFLLTEAERISYFASEQTMVLKMRFLKEQISPDSIDYHMELVLEPVTDLNENEFELCRYKLQEGARLRETYKSFEDMGTEYDMLNHMYASWGGLNGKAMSPVITGRFAEEILNASGCTAQDISFAYLCLNRPDAIPRKILLDYIGRRTGVSLEDEAPNERIFREMCTVLENIGDTAVRKQTSRVGKRRIVVE